MTTEAIEIKKEIPETITLNLDVNDESYNKGFDDAYQSCNQHEQLESYFGYTSYQWKQMAFAYMPVLAILVFILFLLFILRRTQSKNLAAYDRNLAQIQKSLENQEKAIAQGKKTNELLQQLLEKIDGK